jgi:hypothetical protein
MSVQMRSPSALTALVVLAAAFVLGAAAPPPTQAATGIRYGLTDDAWLKNGPGTLDDRLATLDRLGVRVVRYSIRWNAVAPTRPAAASDPADAAYDWSDDEVLDGLHAHGIEVLAQLVGTPRWANGGKAPNWAPVSASTFRSFATAAATKYPWVMRWLIWNEPNQARWLRPTTAAVYTSRLLNPAYDAIHELIPGAQVAGGGTAPRAGAGGVSPVTWLTAMRRAHARLDAYAHNPYPLDPKRESPLSGGCARCATITMATISKLVGLVSRNFPRARIWLTEYGYQTNPPDRLLGVSPALQATYASEGAYAAYRAARVDLLIHFLYRDEPNLDRFQSGLVTLGEKVKPSFAAFELPLAQTVRHGPRVSLWGEFRAPDTGSTAEIERRVGRTWRLVATVPRGSGGFFRWTGSLPPRTVVRLHAGATLGAPLALR